MFDRSREFVKLAMKLNYAAAAEELHLSVSALSRHIASLEDELGFALFERNPIQLTRAGRYYLEAASFLIDELDAVVLRGREISAGSAETLSIYMLPTHTAFADVVHEAIAQMRRETPGLSVKVSIADRFHTAEEALLCGKCDLGVVFSRSLSGDSAIAATPFARSELCAWVRRDNPFAAWGEVSAADLCSLIYPMSTNRQSHDAAMSVIRLFESQGVRLRHRIRDDIVSRADFFLTLGKDEFLVEYAEDPTPSSFNPDLVQLRFADPIVTPILFAFPKEGGSPHVGRFIALARALADDRGIGHSD